jgi:two-component system sensor histidine kinase QseC
MTSIRRRLLAILLGLFALAWSLLAIFTYRSARHEIEELFDAQLAQSARVLLTLTSHELEEHRTNRKPLVLGSVLPGDDPEHEYEEKLAYQLWQHKRMLLRSENAPETSLAPEDGYADRDIGGQAWRVFALRDVTRDVRIEVGERYDLRNELVLDTVGNVSWPLLLTLPLLTLLIWVGIGQGLRPLRLTAREIAQRTPRVLDPLSLVGVPGEVRPLVESLNGLLARLHEALEGEQRFTANASHELRTPLAGLKTQAQVALRATEDGERHQALLQIVRGVDRATHLIEQLLTLARLDPDSATARYESVALPAIAAEVLAELGPAALEKGVELGLAEGGRGQVLGDRHALAILLRNLVDNAIRYTPAPGQVEVVVREVDGEVRLRVVDSGPGLPAAERERVFERFYRVPGSSEPGCGLGLSIVQRIAVLHGARIALAPASASGGLCVEVVFPARQVDPVTARAVPNRW